MNLAKTVKRALIAIALLGVCLFPRLLYLNETRHMSYFAGFFLDGEWYRQRAEEAMSGTLLSESSAFRGPLYPWFLAALFSVFGIDPLPVRAVQLFLGGFNGLLVWSVARRVSSPLGAVLATLLYAGYGLFVFFDGQILSVTLEIALLLLVLICVMGDSQAGAGAAGFLLGISALLRPTILPLCIPAALHLSARSRASRRGRTPARAIAVFIVAVAVPILSVVAGYRALLGDWVFVSSQGGINFYLGNNAGSDGSFSRTPSAGDDALRVARYQDSVEEGSRLAAEAMVGNALKPSEVSRHWYREGLRFAAESPWDFLRLLVKRALLVVGDRETDSGIDLQDVRSRVVPWLRAFPVSAGLIVALGLPSLFSRRRDRDGRFLRGAFLVLWGSTALFLVNSRYRVPHLILLLPFAGEYAASLYRAARARAWASLARGAIPVIGLLAATTISDRRLAPAPVLGTHHATLGYAAEVSGDDAAAVKEYRRALDADSDLFSTRYALGNALARLSRFDEAAAEYAALLAARPSYEGLVSNSLGIIALEEGDPERAIAAFRRSLESDPSPLTRANLGVALLEAGRAREAIVELERAHATGEAPGEAGVDLARACLAAGDTARAEACLTALLAGAPRLSRGWVLLSEIRAARGDRSGQAAALRESRRGESSPESDPQR